MASQERSATGNRSGVPCSSHCARLPLINPTLNNKYSIFYTETRQGHDCLQVWGVCRHGTNSSPDGRNTFVEFRREPIVTKLAAGLDGSLYLTHTHTRLDECFVNFGISGSLEQSVLLALEPNLNQVRYYASLE